MAETAANIFRDFVTAGVPSSGINKPQKAAIRIWGTWVESILNAIGINSGTVYQQRALLFADLAKAANTMAWVTNDPTVAYNGIYQKVGGTGTGSWTRVADLPYSFITAIDAGAGTPNAIQATSTIPISGSALVLLNIFEANTGSPVTVSFNGGTALTVKTLSGGDILPSRLTGGMQTLGIVSGSTFRLVTDIDVSAAVAQAEAAAADAETAKNAAEAAASSLLFRIFATVSAATAATIPASSAYIAISEFSPQPRFYKRFASDPGSGSRFQSADGAWWQGLPLPPTALDFANSVARSANATLGAGDLDQVHLWTIGAGTTYTATLPDPDSYIGRLLHLEVDASSRGLLALACVDPIGLFVTGDLVLWAGESLTLVARAGKWEIVGGRCIPCTLYATCPGANVTLPSGTPVLLTSGWITSLGGSIHPGAEWAINGSGQIVTPRKGFYTSFFDVGYSWGTAPTSTYASADSIVGLDAFWGYAVDSSGTIKSAILHATDANSYAKGKAFSPRCLANGGTSVGIDRAAVGAPRFKLLESAAW